MVRNFARWKLITAIAGVFFLLLALVSVEQLNKLGFVETSRFGSGYVLGSIITFSWFMLREIKHGRVDRFLDPQPMFRLFSYISIVLIILFGGLSFVVEIFGNTNWAYNIGSMCGGLFVLAGIEPTVEHYYPHRSN